MPLASGFLRRKSVLSVIGVMDVQQLVRPLAEHLVDAVESRVEIGGAQVTFLVGCKQTVVAFRFAAVAGGGLTAAADAAVGTRHDLDKVVLHLAAFKLLDEPVGIGKTVCDRNAEGEIARRDLKGLDALKTTDAAFRNGGYRGGGLVGKNSADDRFGNAAGDAEDDACTGV